MVRFVIFFLITMGWGGFGGTQNLVPNGSFEVGQEKPFGWSLMGGKGVWEGSGRVGLWCISVTGTGKESNAWACKAWRPEGGKLYLVRFWVRRDPKAEGGTPIAGFSTANRDLWHLPPGQWHQEAFVIRTPKNRPETVLRFGQWHVKGKVQFDGIEVFPVIPVHRHFKGFSLGSGERIRSGIYSFTTDFNGFATNDNRPLYAHTAGFNTNRWVLGGPMSESQEESGAWVIYRHEVGYPFRGATLTLSVGYYEHGRLVVEVSRDGRRWWTVGRFEGLGRHRVRVPNDFFPTRTLWVRFWATGVLQVHRYRVKAKLEGRPPDAVGATWYFALTERGDIMVRPVALTDEKLLFRLKNLTRRRRFLTLVLGVVRAKEGSSQREVKVSLPSGQERSLPLPLPSLQAGEQVITLTVWEGRKKLVAMEATVKKPWIEVGGFGYPLEGTETFSLWWCEATYKVGRTTPRPKSRLPRSIEIEAARNEYEPFQLVIFPRAEIGKLWIRATPFEPLTRFPSQAPRPVWDEIALVEYVPVTIPTDRWGAVGDYPDPLVPLWRRDREGVRVREEILVSVGGLGAGQNRPFWLTVFVPKGTPAGAYQATLFVGVTEKAIPVPVTVRVFDFTLPDETHLRTAYGVSLNNAWHRLKSEDQFRRVWDLYMQTCHRYRISPYRPHAYAPIRWASEGPGFTLDNGVLRLILDRWKGRVATVQVRLSSGDMVTVGGILPLLEQFEREGVGWKGKGIGWVGTEILRDIRFVERSPRRIVVDVTAERMTTQTARRKFQGVIRLTLEAGKPYFTVQLRRLANTDTVRWRVNSYYHLIPPDRKPSRAINGKSFGAWVFADAKQTFAFGVAGKAFRYSVRINPQTGNPHGDVVRGVRRWLNPGETWSPKDEPVAYVFFWEAGREELEAFVQRLLGKRAIGQPHGTVRLEERKKHLFRYDFSDFDRAMGRYLDGFKFNSFGLDILPQTLGGHPRFSPEWSKLYKRLMAPIIAHLRRKGWLKKAYYYWVDEPPPERYEEVKRGMAALKEACPGLKRLLTLNREKSPTPIFYGYVDIWVPIFSLFDPEGARERQALGEEVWWYVCTGPKAPYPNNFIDHPAITHRIRYWMAVKWRLDGELYWNMTYWSGKGWRVWNPWEDGQSETPRGGYWGNGDGRLLYPPVRKPLPEGADPVIAPPIPSLRLALIAEGLEDFEYFWLLQRLVEWGRKVRQKTPPLLRALREAEKALKATDRLIRSQTEYDHDPQKLYAERRKVALAIEGLSKLLRGPSMELRDGGSSR